MLPRSWVPEDASFARHARRRIRVAIAGDTPRARAEAELRLDRMPSAVLVAGLDCVDDLLRLATHVDCDLYVTIVTQRSTPIDRCLARLQSALTLSPLLLLVDRDCLPRARTPFVPVDGPVCVAPLSLWALRQGVETVARQVCGGVAGRGRAARVCHAWTPGCA